MYLTFPTLQEAETRQAEIALQYGYHSGKPTKRCVNCIKRPTDSRGAFPVLEVYNSLTKQDEDMQGYLTAGEIASLVADAAMEADGWVLGLPF